jgi:hypothetical protein
MVGSKKRFTGSPGASRMTAKIRMLIPSRVGIA